MVLLISFILKIPFNNSLNYHGNDSVYQISFLKSKYCYGASFINYLFINFFSLFLARDPEMKNNFSNFLKNYSITSLILSFT